ncbi:hypothetical protein ENKNEFLB_00025 [Nocardioides aquaticus]|uniref:SURF1-like protein n=1 Tax=Nocardioides aquaticus TaxID=160826 RepID=A0ABX8EBE5_9ACTN|nr:SURF1 family protein [Nocardioides aquaticus]QVT77661.1 hypothetical protein ENKNEFLB_00025 [Nocardioides aquaticus]
MRAFLTPRMLGAHLLALVLVTVALLLAAWQFAAWDARRDAEARDLSRIEPLAITEALGPDDPFLGDLVGQPVVLEGRWLDDATVLVSGRESEGREGFWVVTPLQEDATGSALPVVRGWTADESDVPPAPTGEAEMVAYLQPPRAGSSPTPTPPTTSCPSCAPPTSSSASRSTSTARTRWSRRPRPTPSPR